MQLRAADPAGALLPEINEAGCGDHHGAGHKMRSLSKGQGAVLQQRFSESVYRQVARPAKLRLSNHRVFRFRSQHGASSTRLNHCCYPSARGRDSFAAWLWARSVVRTKGKKRATSRHIATERSPKHAKTFKDFKEFRGATLRLPADRVANQMSLVSQTEKRSGCSGWTRTSNPPVNSYRATL